MYLKPRTPVAPGLSSEDPSCKQVGPRWVPCDDLETREALGPPADGGQPVQPPSALFRGGLRNVGRRIGPGPARLAARKGREWPGRGSGCEKLPEETERARASVCVCLWRVRCVRVPVRPSVCQPGRLGELAGSVAGGRAGPHTHTHAAKPVPSSSRQRAAGCGGAGRPGSGRGWRAQQPLRAGRPRLSVSPPVAPSVPRPRPSPSSSSSSGRRAPPGASMARGGWRGRRRSGDAAARRGEAGGGEARRGAAARRSLPFAVPRARRRTTRPAATR